MPPDIHLKEKKASPVVNMGTLNSHKTFAVLFFEQLNSDLHLARCLKNTHVHLVQAIFMAACIYTSCVIFIQITLNVAKCSPQRASVACGGQLVILLRWLAKLSLQRMMANEQLSLVQSPDFPFPQATTEREVRMPQHLLWNMLFFPSVKQMTGKDEVF